MKMTVLDFVQTILSDLNSDSVSSISDTVESEQIAIILRDTYEEMVVTRKYLDLNKYVRLDSSTDSLLPTYMKVPSNVSDVKEIRYKGELVEKVSREDFFLRVNGRNESSDNVVVMLEPDSGIELKITNNFKPMCWTSFDDENIVFDSWEADVSETLSSKDVVAYCEVIPEFSLTDGFIPKLPLKAYPLLLAEAKSKAFADIKQMASAKEEQKSRRMRAYLSREKNTTGNGIRYPNYGRK